MVGSLGVPMYFKAKAHARLASYMNILRRNLSTTCTTSQTVACDVTAVNPIKRTALHADGGGV